MALSDFFRALARRMGTAAVREEAPDTMNDAPLRGSRNLDVENAISTFKELISELGRNGSEIGELYLSAERKAARYALLSENVIESVTSGILVVDGMHEICLANSAAKRALGCDENLDLAGRQLDSLFEDCKHLQALVSRGFRSCRNFSRKVIKVTLHGGREVYLGVSTSCAASGGPEPEAVIIVFTRLDEDAAGLTSGEAGPGSASAAAYRKGMLDAYGIVSEIYTELESLRAELEGGGPEPARLAAAAERVGFACDLMVGFALSKTASGGMTELVDLNGLVRNLLEGKGLSGRRVVARLAPGLPRVSTLRRLLEAGLEMLLGGCVAESADGVEVGTRLEGAAESPSVTLSIVELSPTMPMVEAGGRPQGFLAGAGLRREAGLMLLKCLPGRGHAVTVSRDDGRFTYSVGFLLPKLGEKENKTSSGGLTDGESSDGGTT